MPPPRLCCGVKSGGKVAPPTAPSCCASRQRAGQTEHSSAPPGRVHPVKSDCAMPCCAKVTAPAPAAVQVAAELPAVLTRPESDVAPDSLPREGVFHPPKA